MDIETKATLQQAKLNALSAKNLHAACRESLNRKSQVVDFLGIAVPSVYFPLRYYAQHSPYDVGFELVWTVLAILLAIATIAKMAYQWTDKAQKHSELLGANISLVGHVNSLLREEEISKESLRLFLLIDEKREKDDRGALGHIPLPQRQAVYREALKELNPGDPNVLCPVCKASPWKYTSGPCQMCGNAPAV